MLASSGTRPAEEARGWTCAADTRFRKSWPTTPAGGGFTPGELRGVCRSAGEGFGREDAGEARFRSAAEMVEMWRGLDLPAWVAPYALRDARLGYLRGYETALVSGELPEELVERAARARWGEGWEEKLERVRDRAEAR